MPHDLRDLALVVLAALSVVAVVTLLVMEAGR